VAINGTIYVAGGKDAAGGITNTLFAYRTTTNTWSNKARMPVPGGCGGSGVIGGRLYVFSGCKRLSTGANDAAGLLHRYDPVTNGWTTLRSAPVVHVQPAVGAIGGKLYVAGGNNGAAGALTRLDVYDPATNTWTSKAAMPTARVAMGAAVVGGRLYVMGGRTGATYLDAVEAYNPVTNSWSTRTPMINRRAGLAAAAINQLIYTMGGRNDARLLTLNERFTP
jgi:N-acetylneuraminic acid mutarotase